MKENCEHKLVLIDTKKLIDCQSDWNSRYTKVYRFFCEKCGEIIEKRKEDYTRYPPDWY